MECLRLVGSLPPGGEGPPLHIHFIEDEEGVVLEFDGTAKPQGDLDRYLQAAFEIANTSPSNRPALFYIAHLVIRHRRNQTVLIMPRPVQAVVFGVVVAVGTLLGKYRGTDWPGCPARCTGAAPARPAS